LVEPGSRYLADELVRRETIESLQPTTEVASSDEVGDVAVELIVRRAEKWAIFNGRMAENRDG
jgi:hypothetical protein